MHVEECYMISTEPNMWIAHIESGTRRKYVVSLTLEKLQPAEIVKPFLWEVVATMICLVPSHRQ